MTDHLVAGGQGNVGWASVPSDAHPQRNEDAFFAMPDRGFFGVFDGMRGHAAADVAARIASDEAQDVLMPLAPDAASEAVADTLRDALFSADVAIRAESQAHGGARGMGTTATLVAVRPQGRDTWSAMIGWVGDSRALLIPHGAPAGVLQALTLDDSVVRLHAPNVAQAKKVQATLGAVTNTRSLTLRERDLFLERNVLTQTVGDSLKHVHVADHTLGGGDRLLLTTDGVHDNLTDTEVAVIARRAPTAQDAALRLVTAARVRSSDQDHIRAKPDDMTALVVRVG